MIRVSQVKLEPGKTEQELIKKVSHIINVPAAKISDFKVLKKSRDARRHDQIRDIYSVTLSVQDEELVVRKCASNDVRIMNDIKYVFSVSGRSHLRHRPVIAGFGPSGIFAAYILAMNGYRPLVLERGYDAIKRTRTVNEFFSSGRLDTKSNVMFGEGGAGTFSDGKLNTLVKDEAGRNRFVLETFVKFGAPEKILTDAKPHLGTDILTEIIPAIRREIVRLGGEVRFESEITDIDITNGCLKGVTVNGKEYIDAEVLFLCIGHSARNTLRMLNGKKLDMEAKAFAVGVRAEHRRDTVDRAMGFESAPYKVTHKCDDGRGVYSFCMCPGGFVVNSSSEEGRLCVNGMSYSKRDGANSNAAIVVTVSPSDYGADSDDTLSGVRFQEQLEERAYAECGGKIPYQRFGDFRNGVRSEAPGTVKPQCRGLWSYGNIRNILPDYICEDICEGFEAFEKQLNGFSDPDTLISAVESRTSSPVRIKRGENLQSSVSGIYPAGEGAGYAGGIMSAAMDGLKCAESFAEEWSNI